MTDITAGETNDVPIGTGIQGTSLAQNTIGYVFGAATTLPTINGIEGIGGPGGQNLRPGGFGTNSGGAGVIGYGGDAGKFEDLNEILPPGPGVVGQGGSGSAYGVQGAPGVVGVAGAGTADGVQGYGTGSFSGVAGFGDPAGNGTGVYGEGHGQDAPGARGIGSGGPNTGPAGPAGVYGQGGPQHPGVVGQAGSGPADGVQGYGTGSFSGVAGFGDQASNGTGVFGMGLGPGAVGVRGNRFRRPERLSVQSGRRLRARRGRWSRGRLGAGAIGVLAQGSNVGVVAEGEGGTGLSATGATVGVNGQGHTGVVAASNGQPGSIGLFASGNAADQLAGEFLGEVFILGDLVVSGLKSAVVPVADGTRRRCTAWRARRAGSKTSGSARW